MEPVYCLKPRTQPCDDQIKGSLLQSFGLLQEHDRLANQDVPESFSGYLETVPGGEKNRQFYVGTELRPLVFEWAAEGSKPRFPDKQQLESIVSRFTPGPPGATGLDLRPGMAGVDGGAMAKRARTETTKQVGDKKAKKDKKDKKEKKEKKKDKKDKSKHKAESH
eukprot:TRINITY_DN5044_c0_g3_i1.p1 TRINITY_DN5044_c0_g3~~TRINITY_DN5044_c0_g3_i1.p1  ORF type:complete len:165 (+),score=44.68 TRINITY_DN5044_c0_g3_i1:84-578(+)